MIDSLLPHDRSWLEKFFSGRNALKWESVVERSASPVWLEQVLPWVSYFSLSETRSQIVLPVFGPNGPCQWYGMATDEVCANALAEELMAFVGPSFSDFRGNSVQLDTEDNIEKALQDRFGRFVFRLEPVSESNTSDISGALQLYLGLLRRRPNVPDRTQRPFGKIRAEFDLALLAGNEVDAEILRDELVSSGRIDAEQQKYLDIRMLAGLGHQYQLAHDYPLVKSVLGLSLPAQTIADLVEALYATYIEDIEDCGNDDAILATFKRDIADNYGPLFLERKGIRHPNVLKAFMLFELAQAEPNRERCEAILAAFPKESGGDLVERWAKRLAPKPSSRLDLFESARQALADEDYDLALQLSFDAFPDSWTYGAMLRCAVEIGESDVALRVLEVLDKAPEAEHKNLTKRDQTRLQQLRATTTGTHEIASASKIRPEADWLSWVSYVETGGGDRPPLQILEMALPRWSIDDYVFNPERCRELADRIGNASGASEQTIRDAFASFVEFFIDRPISPVRGFSPLYAMLIRMVAWNGMVSANELELASSAVQALISLAPPKEDYVEAVDAYAEILAANSVPSNVNWALNAAEMLALYVSPDSEARLRFFIRVVEMTRALAHRLRPIQYEVLSILAKDYGCSGLLEAFPSKESAVEELMPRSNFAGLIGIYTLTEAAGQRAQQFLRKLLPQAGVEINSDHVATDKLKSLAANADIFVFAWKSSKHQAYYAAKESRGSKKTLLPLGKGSASILECVLSELG